MHRHGLSLLLLVFSCLASTVLQNRTFVVDYEKGIFLKDGEPFSYISGEIHYFRIPRQYWRDRLEKVKAAGLDTICTYVEWSLHEPVSEVYNFADNANLYEFLDMATELGLYIILRPGPYICAEREFGGYPSWLLAKNPHMNFRTSDPTHTFYVERWFNVLMPRLIPYFYGNGGNIIMVQVENEYGYYPVNDQTYLLWLRDLMKKYVREAAVLFTTDNNMEGPIKRGRIPGVLTTVDFGAVSGSALDNFSELKKVQKGPLVCSEFYVGWLTYWGKPWQYRGATNIVNNIEEFIANNVSFNMYMIHGGTNFGFSAGSQIDDHFVADVTSYDYDAPITEAGDLTEKYIQIRKAISKFRFNNSTLPQNNTKGDFGPLRLTLLCNLYRCPIGMNYPESEAPITFESLGQPYGFISYATLSQVPSTGLSILQATIRDRAVVYLDDEEVGLLEYTVNDTIALGSTYQQGKRLRLLVENMGRRNFDLLSDCTKGLISNVTISGQILSNWTVTGYPLNPSDIEKLDNISPTTEKISFPAIFRGVLHLRDEHQPKDTYISMDGWGKGVVFVNSFNLGRYWSIGPQRTLFLPAAYLTSGKNVVTVVELHFHNPDSEINFHTAPIIRD